ncbi:hypothetical protein [Ancylomarina sp. 16SWW S1-10-2]|uniref:hypothetical protein n=1 Tax=Ancylomarina sp. 16SWW S1-10-2 TaxID=2499681 RepID=UPI0012AD737E|nr:hypothetical protein [Ancylomarina sp. 16SWW S1-10-2]MRT91535.1 hypothetical protein [Ancylomarina sp. 16SWW S1-10-2]
MKPLLEIDYKNIDIEDLIEIFSQSILGHTRPLFRDFSSKAFFRARKINGVKDDELEKTKSIWYPDWSEIKPEHYTYNRCSNKGENFFYASNSIEATVREMNLVDGDRLLIGIFKPNNSNVIIPSQFAGIEKIKKAETFERILSNHKYRSVKDMEFEEWIASFFEKKVSLGDECFYKTCIAFSKILLSSEDTKCLIYPSVASNSQFVNFGIKPDFVDEFLWCDQAFIYNVLVEDNLLSLIPEKYSSSEVNFDSHPKNWNLNWKENTQMIKLNGVKVYGL